MLPARRLLLALGLHGVPSCVPSLLPAIGAGVVAVSAQWRFQSSGGAIRQGPGQPRSPGGLIDTPGELDCGNLSRAVAYWASSGPDHAPPGANACIDVRAPFTIFTRIVALSLCRPYTCAVQSTRRSGSRTCLMTTAGGRARSSAYSLGPTRWPSPQRRPSGWASRKTRLPPTCTTSIQTLRSASLMPMHLLATRGPAATPGGTSRMHC